MAQNLEQCIHLPNARLVAAKPSLDYFIQLFGKHPRSPQNVPCWRDLAGNLKPITDDCVLCAAMGHRFRLVLGQQYDKQVKLVKFDLVRQKAFEKGTKEVGDNQHDPKYFQFPTFPSMLEQNSYQFVIPAGQFGEVYHGLVACFLMPSGSVAIQPGNLQDKTFAPETDALLDFYEILKLHPQKPVTTAKDQSTAIAVQFFIRYDEKSLFEMIRRKLDKYPHNPNPIYSGYARQSYLGKYWLNRFLTVTKQGGGSTPRGGPNRRDTVEKVGKMPKNSDVQRMAVIVIRRSVATTGGRVMDANNLATCLASIEAANEVAIAQNEPCFTHVLLYGDIQAPEANEIVQNYKDSKTFKSKQINLLYISKPWSPTPQEVKENSKNTVFQQTQNFWAEFRGDATLPFPIKENSEAFYKGIPEGAPLQVKILSFFLALRERYGSKICYIGFRSGFLDGAAFLGSPIFYFDDTYHETLTKLLGKDKLGKLLYSRTLTTSAVGEYDVKKEPRMVAAGNHISTFIRIDVASNGEKSDINLKTQTNTRAILTGALYMYMLAKDEKSTPAGEPFWVRRSKLINDGNDKTLKELFEAREKFFNVKWGS